MGALEFNERCPSVTYGVVISHWESLLLLPISLSALITITLPSIHLPPPRTLIPYFRLAGDSIRQGLHAFRGSLIIPSCRSLQTESNVWTGTFEHRVGKGEDHDFFDYRDMISKQARSLYIDFSKTGVVGNQARNKLSSANKSAFSNNILPTPTRSHHGTL